MDTTKLRAIAAQHAETARLLGVDFVPMYRAGAASGDTGVSNAESVKREAPAAAGVTEPARAAVKAEGEFEMKGPASAATGTARVGASVVNTGAGVKDPGGVRDRAEGTPGGAGVGVIARNRDVELRRGRSNAGADGEQSSPT